jgi:hypothetical protein
MRTELHETKEHLKKYTAPTSRRRYYEKHRELEKQRAKEYKVKTNYKPTPEQLILHFLKMGVFNVQRCNAHKSLPFEGWGWCFITQSVSV